MATAVVDGTVYLVKGFVTNVFILCDPREGLTLIDTGLPFDADPVLAGLRSVAAATPRAPQLRRVLVTHADPDHVGALAAVVRAHPGAEVVSSAAVSEAIALGYHPGREPKDPKDRQQMAEHLRARQQVTVEGIPGGATRTVGGGDVIAAVPGGLRVVESAGHTPGHLSFWAAGVAGGTMFAGDSCRVSADGTQVVVPPRPFNWDQPMAEEATHALMALGPKVVCAAHGPVWRSP
eukprot:m51a1_g9234 hypothetical protein (235) ;mRNA; r:87756-88535